MDLPPLCSKAEGEHVMSVQTVRERSEIPTIQAPNKNRKIYLQKILTVVDSNIMAPKKTSLFLLGTTALAGLFHPTTATNCKTTCNIK